MAPDEVHASTAPGARPRVLHPFMRQHCREAVRAHAMAGAGSAMVKAGGRIYSSYVWTVAAQRTQSGPTDGERGNATRRPGKG